MLGYDSEWCQCCGYFLACLGTLTARSRPEAVALLESTSGPVATHAGLNDYTTLGYWPVHLDNHDSYILAWLLDENGKHGLKELAPRLLGRGLDDPIKFNETTGQVEFFGVHIAEADQAEVTRYCMADAQASADLTQHLLARLPKRSLAWYTDVEQPLQHALFKMAQRGVGIDENKLAAEEAVMAVEIPKARAAVFSALGYEFQLSAATTQELEYVLYEKTWTRKHDHVGVVGYYKTCAHRKQPDKCKAADCNHLPQERPGWRPADYPGLGLQCHVRTTSGQRSTSEEALMFHAANPVVQAVLAYRELVKVHQFLLSWRKFLHNGRLYPRLDSVGTVTGRFACRDPNLQQVPKQGELGKRMRGLFVAAPGKVLIACDQDAVEARVAASCACDTEELTSFRQGADVHQLLADDMGCSRDAGKTTRYTIIFGGGGKRVSATLATMGFPTTPLEGKALITKFFKARPKLAAWKQRVEEAAQRSGTLLTLGGRTRHLYTAQSHDYKERGRALRQAVSSVVQGSASDLTKLWIVKADRLDVPMVLTVHDEVLAEEWPENVVLVCGKLEDTLRQAGEELGLKCPITGKAQGVTSWGQKT